MLKGVNRNVIVVTADANSRFESVYFVLKRGEARDSADLLKEANRIIAESGLSRKPIRKKRRFVLAFALGGFSGVILGAFACFLIMIC